MDQHLRGGRSTPAASMIAGALCAIPLLAAPLHAIAAAPVAAAPQPCPEGPFETDAAAIAASFATPVPDPEPGSVRVGPPEIARIRLGSVRFFEGAFINDGLITWTAYDAERHLFVSVSGTAGRFRRVPDPTRLGPGQTVRYLFNGQRVDLITVVKATPQQAREFACRANEISSSSEALRALQQAAQPSQPPVPPPGSRAPGTRLQMVIVEGHRIRPGCAQPMPTDTLANSFRLLAPYRDDTQRAGTSASQPEARTGPLSCAMLEKLNYDLAGWVAKPLQEPVLRAEGAWQAPFAAGLTVDAADNLYLLIDAGTRTDNKIRVLKISRAGTVTALTASTADTFYGWFLTVDPRGDILIPEFSGNRIRVIHPGGEPGAAAEDRVVHFRADEVNQAIDAISTGRDGRQYLIVNSSIVELTGADGVTLAGSDSQGHLDGVGAAASFRLPDDIATAANGDILVSDGDNIIRRVTAAGVVTTLAKWAGRDLPAAPSNARAGIAVDRHGNVYVADHGDDTILRITPAGRISTYAGKRAAPGTVDGWRLFARFQGPSSLAVDSTGTLYVLGDDHSVRRISPHGFVRTLQIQRWLPQDGDAILGGREWNSLFRP